MRGKLFLGYSAIVVLVLLLGYKIYRDTYVNGDTKYFYVNQSLEETYGLKYNPTRRALGIRELPKNWFTYDTSQKPGIWNGRTKGKQDIFWLNQVWIPIDPKVSGRYEKEIRRTSETLIYEKDRFRKVINDSLEYILEVKYNYKYDPKKGSQTTEKLF